MSSKEHRTSAGSTLDGDPEGEVSAALNGLRDAIENTTNDLWLRAERPFLLDLLAFYDGLEWFRDEVLVTDSPRDVLRDAYQHLLDDFLELMEKRDVVRVASAGTHEPTLQRVVRTIPTTDASEHGRVVQVCRKGFARDGLVIRREDVVVLENAESHVGSRHTVPALHTDSES